MGVGKWILKPQNDVFQVVNMQFEGGATATLTMVAFTEGLCTRQVMIYGTKVCIESRLGLTK
jgi:hypothetical protein